MNKIRSLSFLALALFLTNIGLLVFIYNGGNNNPKEKGPRNIIIKKLSFSEDQVAQYDKLIEQHRKEIRTTEESIRKTKQQLYITLKSDTAAVANVQYLDELGKLQMEIEQIHYAHFLDIKKLCKTNQLPAFNSLTEELSEHFTHQPKKGKRN
jgi:Spy/CpxP family protein refolding chaperone